MREGPVRTKSKFTTMFHVDSTADDACLPVPPYPVHEFQYCAPGPMHEIYYYWLKSQTFPTFFSFSVLIWGDLLRIYGKALLILKLESFRQPTVKI